MTLIQQIVEANEILRADILSFSISQADREKNLNLLILLMHCMLALDSKGFPVEEGESKKLHALAQKVWDEADKGR